jgi:hypothetical protein
MPDLKQIVPQTSSHPRDNCGLLAKLGDLTHDPVNERKNDVSTTISFTSMISRRSSLGLYCFG